MSITYTVGIALGYAPLDPAPVFTDVTAYVRADLSTVKISRGGRPDEFSDPQPGRLSLTLDNSDGRFTPASAASPYFPNIVKNVRVRVAAIVSGVTYPRWDGHADDWALTYDGDTYTAAVITLTATSRARLVAARGQLRSFLTEEYLLDNPITYLPLDDPSTATTVQNIAPDPIGNGALVNIGGGGTYSLATGTGPPADGSSALVLTPASSVSGYYAQVPVSVYSVGTPFGITLEAWINTVTGTSVAVDVLAGPKSSLFSLTLDATKHLQSFADFGGLSVTSPLVVGNGATRHVAVTVAADGTNHVMRLYVDGTQVGTQSVANPNLSLGCDRVRIGGDGYNFLYTGTVSHVAFYTTALPATRLLSHYLAGWTGFGGERSDQRVARIASYVGLSSTVASGRTGVWVFDDPVLAVFDTTTIFAGADVSTAEVGSATVYGQARGGSEASAALNEVARTENGIVLFGRTGELTFQARSHRYNSTAAFSLDASVVTGLDWRLDSALQVNDQTVLTEDGISQRARNTPSIAANGRISPGDIQSLTRDPLDAYSNASWRVNRYGDLRPRLSTVSVELATLPDSVAQAVLVADVSTMFILTGLLSPYAPSGGGPVSLFVEDYSEEIGLGFHVVTFTTSSAVLSQVWIFDDARFAVFNSTTIFAF